jgi:hypothetical protein
MKKQNRYLLNLVPFLFILSCSQLNRSQLMPLTYKSIWEKAGFPGGIPAIKSNIINVMDKGATADGITDNYGIIQSTIDNAPVPGVIFFPAGIYRINGQLNLKSGIVLRGKDSKSTRLEFDSKDGCIQAKGTNSENYVKITAGSGFGSNKIVVTDASGFKVGDGGHIRQGMVHKTTLTWLENPRTVGQMVKITEIKGNTLIIEPALNFDYASNPPLDGQGTEISMVKYIERTGIENMHIKRIHSDAEGGGNNITFTYAENSWVKRVESEYTLKYHISVSQSIYLEIRENCIHHARSRGGGGQGYGVSLAGQTTATLVEDNIFYELRHAMISQTGVNGCVIGYNYDERNYNDEGGDMTAISFHGHYAHLNLVEGNVVSFIGIGDWWGPDGPDNTILRNRVMGTDRHAGFGDNRGIMYRDYDGPQYIIGNEVIGGKIYFARVDSSDSDPSLVVVHGNNIKGIVSWDPGIASHKIPESLYRNSKPSFFKELNWPPFGGDNQIGSGTIPALERWRNGNFIPSENKE